MKTKDLIKFGIYSSILYIGMNIFIPLFYPGYDFINLTVSEISAVDTPTRPMWVFFATIYTILIIGFAWGVRRIGSANNRLKSSGTFLLIYGIMGIYWPPMHQREILEAGGGTITDTLHIVGTAIAVPLMIISMIYGGLSFDWKFKKYTFITLAILIITGTFTSIDGPKIGTGVPTPWMGVWERISILAFMLWIISFARKIKKNYPIHN